MIEVVSADGYDIVQSKHSKMMRLENSWFSKDRGLGGDDSNTATEEERNMRYRAVSAYLDLADCIVDGERQKRVLAESQGLHEAVRTHLDAQQKPKWLPFASEGKKIDESDVIVGLAHLGRVNGN